MFSSTGVLSPAELQSRCEVKWENYSLKLQIESRVLGDLVINHVLPAAKRYQKTLLEKVAHVKQVFDTEEAKSMNEQDCLLIRRIESHASAIIAGVDKMTGLRVTANHIENQRERAIAFHDTVVPIMEEIRKHVDELEMWIDDQLWTLPKYRELLFIR
jgi:glutamine synthetase